MDPFDLPLPISGLKSSLSVGMNDDGILDELVHLLGGCASPYIPISSGYDTSEFGPGGDSGASSTSTRSIIQTPHEIVCPDVTNTNFVFDPKNHTEFVREARPMPRPRHKHSTIALNGHIWVLGGRDELGQVIHEIDVYDSLREEWRTLSTGLESIQVDDSSSRYDYNEASDFCVFDIGFDIFITGGLDSDFNALDHTVMIDTDASLASNTLVYQIKSSLNLPRGSCSAVSHANFAFVAGGFTHEDGFCEAMKSVEIYNFMSDSWIEMEDQLSIGRANFEMFYFQGSVVAFGGETRGTYDQPTGRCIDRFHVMDGFTKEMNQDSPNRLTFPVATENIDVFTLTHDHPDFSLSWSTKKTNLRNHGKVGFSLISYPSTFRVFMFGGAWHNFDMIIDPSDPSESQSCFELSSEIDIFMHPLDKTVELLNWALLTSLCVLFLVFILLMKRCKSKNDPEEEKEDVFQKNEQGMLIRNGHLWGGDVFSSDLEIEELEWGTEAYSTNVELKQIT